MTISTLPLWPAGCPNNPPADQPQPRLAIFQPDRRETNPRAAVIVCPGGGYAGLAPHEGDPFAALFTAHGFVSAVLYYRVAPWKFPAPQADACRAIRLLRANAGQFGVDPQRIGLMGFSAGGHLVATTAAQPDLHHDQHDDLVDTVSARPDRAILAYPVASFGEHTHLGSVHNLLGNPPDPQMREQLSNEKHVTANHPPTFLFHTADDDGVPVQNSLLYADACRRARVPVELHVYESGWHGVGLALDNPALCGWSNRLLDWLRPWRL
ncbi:MAG: Acetylxylan esterase [Verrucomicrobiae bacterium]|nr:Acetylxylan esterase [Verrucomicrobiae bacterium]